MDHAVTPTAKRSDAVVKMPSSEPAAFFGGFRPMGDLHGNNMVIIWSIMVVIWFNMVKIQDPTDGDT